MKTLSEPGSRTPDHDPASRIPDPGLRIPAAHTRRRKHKEIQFTVVKTMSRDVSAALSTNQHLLRWVRKMADLARPQSIHWVDGSQEEYDQLCDEMVKNRTLVRLNQDLWPGCFYAR